MGMAETVSDIIDVVITVLLGGSVVRISVSRTMGMGVPLSGEALTGVPGGSRRSLAGDTPKGVIGPLRKEPSKSRENPSSQGDPVAAVLLSRFNSISPS